MKNQTTLDLTVVIPFLNEEGSLNELHRQLTETLSGSNLSYELLFIDDGSTDESNRIVAALRASDPHIRLITFRRNQGKSAALAVGFKGAVGHYVITMDADLQDDPKEIPHLIAKLEEGYDLVSGWKKKRHDPLGKRLPSKVFNGVTSHLSGVKLHDFNCGLKIYRSEVIKEIEVYGERHRYLPVIAHFHGFKVGELVVQHHPRQFGTTKFGMYRYIAGFFDIITLMFRMKFLTKPMHFFGSAGMLSFLAGFGILLYLSVGWCFGRWIGNRPILLIGVLGVITGVQLFTLGLLAEMITGNAPQKAAPMREDSDIEPRG
jgi:glycosyltransferase involved in cell wall biosynthesis